MSARLVVVVVVVVQLGVSAGLPVAVRLVSTAQQVQRRGDGNHDNTAATAVVATQAWQCGGGGESVMAMASYECVKLLSTLIQSFPNTYRSPVWTHC